MAVRTTPLVQPSIAVVGAFVVRMCCWYQPKHIVGPGWWLAPRFAGAGIAAAGNYHCPAGPVVVARSAAAIYVPRRRAGVRL